MNVFMRENASSGEKTTEVSFLRFGAFELHLKAGELRKGGALVSLPPQPFKVLALLISHPGELVTREAIRREIWGSATFVDFEQSINYAINKIRTALGDNADNPHYIETLPKRGYRFISRAEPVPSVTTTPAQAPVFVPDSSSKPAARANLLIAIAGLAIIAVLCVFVFARKRVVVVASQDFPETELVAEMVAEMLEAKGIRVVRVFKQDGIKLEAAIANGQVDCMLDYTGAPYTQFFQKPPQSDPRAVLAYIRREYEKKGVVLSEPFGFQNNWVMLIRSDEARRLSVHKLSDIGHYAAQWKAGYVPALIADTLVGGPQGFEQRYGLRFAHSQEMDLSKIYDALANREFDFISGNSTDGELLDHDFTELADDLHYFPPYEPVLLARRAVLQRVPELNTVMGTLPKQLTLREIRLLNYQIHKNPSQMRQIVCNWLATNGDVLVESCGQVK
jgi:glycine betaine/choline ABC-type transport system substrate-binding protein/DNA-binding winged helix-turn-helix (wHTH) protein